MEYTGRLDISTYNNIRPLTRRIDLSISDIIGLLIYGLVMESRSNLVMKHQNRGHHHYFHSVSSQNSQRRDYHHYFYSVSNQNTDHYLFVPPLPQFF